MRVFMFVWLLLLLVAVVVVVGGGCCCWWWLWGLGVILVIGEYITETKELKLKPKL